MASIYYILASDDAVGDGILWYFWRGEFTTFALYHLQGQWLIYFSFEDVVHVCLSHMRSYRILTEFAGQT